MARLPICGNDSLLQINSGMTETGDPSGQSVNWSFSCRPMLIGKIMCTSIVPHNEWAQFLQSFTSQHRGWLVSMETYDLQTGETVTSRFAPLQSVELDLEDKNNARINVVVRDGQKEIKRILFRPSDVALQISEDSNDESLRIVSVNTVTTVRFRIAISPEPVDGAA
jgi:hypothetical protein